MGIKTVSRNSLKWISHTHWSIVYLYHNYRLMRGGVQLAIKNIRMKTTPFLYRALLTGVAIFGNLTVSEAQTPKPPLASRLPPSNKTAVPVSIDRQF